MNPNTTSSPTLREIFQDIPFLEFAGDWKTPISSLITDSRRVVPGSVFFAIGGLKTNGESFIEDAIARGASAVVTSSAVGKRFQIACVRVANVRKTLAAVAKNFYKQPEKKLKVLGVTGTNGKTTVSTLVQYLMQQDSSKWGLIGTVRYEIGGRSLPSHRTTPESPEIFGMMAQMVVAGCEGVSMEVSSHAIDQDRVEGLGFTALAFTNLSRDHIDYHHDMEAYFQVKARPFLGECGATPEVAVINIDDPMGCRLAQMLPSDVKLVSFGESPDATVRATDVKLMPGESSFSIIWPGHQGMVRTTLPGHYNVSNVLCALALAYAAGRNLEDLLPAVSSFPGVPGRMERVAPDLPYHVYVDYAHTDDALRNALSMLRKITPGRLLVVFGCGGNRDRGKRPKMTAAVQEMADYAWATADNPRKEAIEDIFEDMKTGVTAPEKITFIPDRRRAISLALDAANEGDCLLIAGKGHETYQEFADVIVPFDDRHVTRELLSLKQCRPT
ncbi:MAG: UDP-N-acetylmuramoyl-L-alanyl-D-glutamate--2,6-diaminopimelate ligase [Puniceicoccales bacterium]|jgi:UDP-N-acetylmuramoyl-L-alanyl-D-glutamate--2,6-diaminopimelate ligase|nr:UDP-N-acetylmuramoyl-L-alanyl-D-glutamate--2,6-diaminopimelate ligase [Puniceicoccales bacterium]